MSGTSPLDYIAAGIWYALPDQFDKGTPFSAVRAQAKLGDELGAKLSLQAVNAALDLLSSSGVVREESDRYAPSEYVVTAEGREKLAAWFFSQVDAPDFVKIRVTYSKRGHEWLKNILGSESFAVDVHRTLQPRPDELTEVKSDHPVDDHGSFQISSIVRILTTEKAATKVVGELSKIEAELPSLPISQEDSAQARSLIVATRALIEAPVPPPTLIWQLLDRLNNIAGIASLFVSVVALLK